MRNDIPSYFTQYGAIFLPDSSQVALKLPGIRAWLFDWDGVFNDGVKGENTHSNFSEVDAMGINMLRFSHYLQHGNLPYTGIITGEQNPSALLLAQREHFDSVHLGYRHKTEGFEQICEAHKLHPAEVGYVFDDILDLGLAERCGLRIFIKRTANPLLEEFIINNHLADYITAHNGANNGLREACEMLICIRGNYEQCLWQRISFSGSYSEYLAERNKAETEIFRQAK